MKTTPVIDRSLLDLLVCPVTGEKLILQGDKLVGSTYSYDIKDGIPQLNPDKRISLDKSE